MNRLLFGACVAALVAVLIVGLSVVGGPNYARMQKTDSISARMLHDMDVFLTCKSSREPLPMAWDDPNYCPERRRASYRVRENPEIANSFDENLVYERISDSAFRICHRFELGEDEQVEHYYTREIEWTGKQGCLSGHNYVEP